jgi:hypothetical protein
LAEPRFQTCADIAREAARLLDDGHSDAARLLHARVAETCVFGPVPCPSNSECRELLVQLQARLPAD